MAGFSTHPYRHHVLRHAELRRSAPIWYSPLRGRYARSAVERGLEGPLAEGLPPEIAEEIPWTCSVSLPVCLPKLADSLGWPYRPDHRASGACPGPCGAVDRGRGVLVAGDMLSDILIPFLDLEAADPIEDTSSGCGCSRAWRMTLMSSSPVTGPSAELVRNAHVSNRIEHTCMPCKTACSR